MNKLLQKYINAVGLVAFALIIVFGCAVSVVAFVFSLPAMGASRLLGGRIEFISPLH